MSLKFEQTIFEIVSNVVRLVRAMPLNLGGYSASGGGSGGPPGGYIGMLPQTRVTYDTTEAETLATTASGSLVDNLNHIRYRIGAVEDLGSTGIDVLDDGVTIAEGIHVVDFIDHFDVKTAGADGVTVALLSSGVLSDVTYSGVHGEDLTPYVNGVDSHFDLIGIVNNSSLEVYLNGVRQSASEYDLDVDYGGFTTTFVPIAGDTLQVDYTVAYTGAFHTHSQYALASGILTLAQVQTLLDTKANLVHTHVEADITDLDHDAVSIMGTPVASGNPLPGEVLQYSSVTGTYVPSTLTVNMQIVFPVSGTLSVGTLPTRIYAHDVNNEATISEVFVCFNTPPAINDMHVNVLKNGATIFSPPAYTIVAAGAYTGTKSVFLDDTFVKDDYFQVKIEQTDSTAANMTVHVRYNYDI